jgi:N6-adenosine-specific RNA methylase IME4
MASFTDLNQIPLFRYGLIMADPAWKFENWSAKGEDKSASAHYRCMSLEDIKQLPVGHYAAKDCLLWLWATNPMLRVAFDVIDSWGFRFVTAGHWVKRTKTGKLAFGTGYALRCAGEPFLLASNGSPETANNVRSVIEGQVREHSRKPAEAYVEAERLCGDVPRLEMFSRQERSGWDVFGDEVSKFGGADAAV